MAGFRTCGLVIDQKIQAIDQNITINRFINPSNRLQNCMSSTLKMQVIHQKKSKSITSKMQVINQKVQVINSKNARHQPKSASHQLKKMPDINQKVQVINPKKCKSSTQKMADINRKK